MSFFFGVGIKSWSPVYCFFGVYVNLNVKYTELSHPKIRPCFFGVYCFFGAYVNLAKGDEKVIGQY